MSLTRLDELFHAARARPAGEWPAFLARECGGDEELASTLLGMLREEGQAFSWFDEAESSLGLFWEEVLPERLGPYRVLRRLGSGGMGTVYLAEGFGRTLAVKCMRWGGAGLLKRFLDERQILSRLDHPGIARFLDGGRTPSGEPYLVMEYIEGTPLSEWERSGRILAERVKLLRAVAETVAYAHENQVVHGDLKPSNVLVTASGQPKLLDFGIAKLLDRGEETGEERQSVALTPAYAAPEQLAGEPISELTDVYGLGALLAELTAEGADPWLAEIVQRAVSPDVAGRYPSVRAMLDDLRAWEQGQRTAPTA
jgi:serine/threonine protein kinase